MDRQRRTGILATTQLHNHQGTSKEAQHLLTCTTKQTTLEVRTLLLEPPAVDTYHSPSMPEAPEINGFYEIIRRMLQEDHRRKTKQLCEPAVMYAGTNETHLEILNYAVSLRIHPQILTKTKSYTTLTTDTSKYMMPSDASSPSSDCDFGDMSWRYLLGENVPGPLIVRKRGRLMILAAGQVSPATARIAASECGLYQHALLLHFGLEAHLLRLRRPDYDEIVSHDVPGPNPDGPKSKLLRSFVMPDRFITPKSSNNGKERTVNILAAFISDTEALPLVDFARLARIHVISRDDIWTELDLDPSSPVRILIAYNTFEEQ